MRKIRRKKGKVQKECCCFIKRLLGGNEKRWGKKKKDGWKNEEDNGHFFLSSLSFFSSLVVVPVGRKESVKLKLKQQNENISEDKESICLSEERKKNIIWKLKLKAFFAKRWTKRKKKVRGRRTLPMGKFSFFF